MSNAITFPKLQVNGNYIEYIPNTLSSVRGVGTVDVEAQINGDSVDPVFKVNKKDAIGQVKFEIEPTSENLKFARSVQDNNPNNDIQFVQDGFSRTMSQAALCTDYEENYGADKTVSLEFKGSQIVG